MVILVANHPEIVVAELKIRLPEAVVVFSLEAFGSPGLSRLSYRVVQACIADNMVGLVVVYGEPLAVEATGNLVGAPFIPLAKLDCFLLERIVNSRTDRTAARFFF